MSRMQVALLPGGKRLHLQDGPIDLIIGADGAPEHVRRAYDVAQIRFSTILDELCTELPLLRRQTEFLPEGAVARRMWRATSDLAEDLFVTPMAAVAGAVAEEVLYAMVTVATLERAHVNNGGDIAFHLAPGQSLSAAIWDAGDAGRVTFCHGDGAGGLATSGWRGRSHSLGIADAVTVIARTAAAADAAATLIANAVDLPGHKAITRTPARDLAPDSDLGDRLVTTDVGLLDPADTARALDAGLSSADMFLKRGLILGAALFLNRETRLCGTLQSPETGDHNARLHVA